jgi:hypothetical protein
MAKGGLNRGSAARGAGLVLKAAATFAVIAAFVGLLDLARILYASMSSSLRVPAAPTASADQGMKPEVGGSAAFWPQFPGADGSRLDRMTINGVETIGQEWQTSASPSDVIEYYREQMVARGWQDATEAATNLQPEQRGPGTGVFGVQNSKFVSDYIQITGTSLVLTRGNWSLQVDVVPSETGIRQSDVRMLAAATPDLETFLLSIGESAFDPEPLRPGTGTVDTVVERNGQRCHSILAVRNDDPGRVFADMVQSYRDRSWSCVQTFPANGERDSYFALLTHGRSYAALSVRPLAEGSKAAIAVTEMSPE